jgi:hypothetical protein
MHLLYMRISFEVSTYPNIVLINNLFLKGRNSLKKEIKSDITSLSEHDKRVLDRYSMSSYSLIESKSVVSNLIENKSLKKKD